LELRRKSFSVRVVRPWNALPESVVSLPSVKAFESRLDEVWKNQPIRFNYKEESTDLDIEEVRRISCVQ